MYYIYRITNKINNKTYIGQHKYKDLSEDNYMGSGKYLWSSYNKYGIENFEKEIIVSEIETKEEVNRLERMYIKLERDSGHGEYNLSNGGDGWNLSGKNHPWYGKHHSEETKRRMSEIRKKENLPEDVLKKLSESKKGNKYHLGIPHSEETRKKLSKAKSGENNPLYGKHHTEETKRKISESHKGKPLSEEAKRKMSETKIGKRLYNNSIECHKYIPGTEPEGYVLGKLS